jgi:hypothetical protein
MEGMKSHPASLPLNPELVQNRMEDFLDHPPPVIRAAQLIGEEQVMRVPYEVFLEQLFDRLASSVARSQTPSSSRSGTSGSTRPGESR